MNICGGGFMVFWDLGFEGPKYSEFEDNIIWDLGFEGRKSWGFEDPRHTHIVENPLVNEKFRAFFSLFNLIVKISNNITYPSELFTLVIQ